MVLVLTVSAVFCAVATFVAVRLLLDRSNPQVVQFANLQEVTVDDGKYHAVDSSEMAFKLAARAGFREAFGNASPIVLEPVSRVAVTVPTRYQGDVMGDIASRRGAVQGTTTNADGSQTVSANIPTSEIMRYAIDLRSITHGWGHFTARMDHYQELPTQLVAKAMAAARE